MLGVNEGNEVDGEGAQSLQNNIWLGGESEETPGQAGTASPGIPNMSAISMDSSNTTEVVNIEYVASEEQIFKVSLAVNVASTTKQGIRDLIQDMKKQDNREMFSYFMEQVIARTDEGQVRFESFNTNVPQLPPQNSTSAQQLNVLLGKHFNPGFIPTLRQEALAIIKDALSQENTLVANLYEEHAHKFTTSQLSTVVCACAVMEWIAIQDDGKNPHSLVSKAREGEFKRQVPASHQDQLWPFRLSIKPRLSRWFASSA